MAEDIEYNTVSFPLAYEGAATSYKMGQQGLLQGSADSLAVRELMYLQMRTEHAIRNNGYAQTAFTKYVTSTGTVEVKWKDAAGKEHKLMQAYWDEFAANPNLDGYGTLANTQVDWSGSMFKTGAAYTRKLIRRRGNKNAIPLKLQTIPTNLHDITYSNFTPTGKNNIFYGIRFEAGAPETYYFRRGIYEKAFLNINNNFKSYPVKASELIHMFIRDTPGQWLGIPKLASVLISLYELDELTDATVAKQKAAQAIAWVIENTNPSNPIAIGAPGLVKDEGGKNKVAFKNTGGQAQYLNKGEKIQFFQGTDIGANLPTLIKSELHKIAATADIAYYMLTGDTEGLDFSSLRGIAVELRQRIEFIHHLYTIPLGLTPLVNTFKDLARLYNRKVEKAIPTFQLPRWYGVDDLKDAQADVLELQYGLGTISNKLAERNLTVEEIMADREILKALNLEHILKPDASAAKQGQNMKGNSNSSGN